MNSDTYVATVEFERSLSEDLALATAMFPNMSAAEALSRHLAFELQEACNQGVAGFFQVTSISFPGDSY